MPGIRVVALGLLAAAVTTVRAAKFSDVITCYAFNGKPYANNTRCPGSDACCGVDDTCLSNRLCHRASDGNDYFIRGPCAVQPWSKGQCAQLCQHNETGLFPRVTTCADGSFCCKDDGDACCTEKKGVFLDKEGNIANGPATTTLSWGPERTSPGYQTNKPRQTQTSATASTSATSTPESSNDSQGTKIGAGVGVSVGVVAIGGGIAAFFWMRRRRRQNRDKQRSSVSELDTHDAAKKVSYTGLPQQAAPQELDSQAYRSELQA